MAEPSSIPSAVLMLTKRTLSRSASTASFHDPNSHELNGLPVRRDRLLVGLRIVSANQRRRGRWGEPLDDM
jgi:hypothetical protein